MILKPTPEMSEQAQKAQKSKLKRPYKLKAWFAQLLLHNTLWSNPASLY